MSTSAPRRAWISTLAACAVSVSLATPRVSPAADVTLQPSQDNTLYESATGALSNGAGQFLFAGQTAQVTGNLRRGLLAFDLSSIPAGSTVTGAVLRLNVSQTISGPALVSLHRVLADWGEGASDALASEGGGAAAQAGDATWIHTFSPTDVWATAGGDFDPSASATTSVAGLAAYTWQGAGMVADLQAWLDAPSTNYGWLVRGDETTMSAKRFDSRQNTVVNNRPRLVVTFDLPPGFANFVRGDCNFDGVVDVADPITLLSFLFPASGTALPPSCMDAFDTNDDEAVDVADAVRLISALFGSPAPPLPPPLTCGPDPDGVQLDCTFAGNCP